MPLLPNSGVLHLADNELTGTIPTELAEFDDLSKCYCDWFSGRKRAQLLLNFNCNCLLRSLTLISFVLLSHFPISMISVTLFLENNDLSGTIPSQIGELSSLGKCLDSWFCLRLGYRGRMLVLVLATLGCLCLGLVLCFLCASI